MIWEQNDAQSPTPRFAGVNDAQARTTSGRTTSGDRRLGRSFFSRAPDDVARDLVGATLVVRDEERVTRVLIVETEAYGGDDDAASHAFRGPTRRCEVMFGPAGHLYVYRIYGLHWCMNVVTDGLGRAGAVLLRAAEVLYPVDDVDAGHETNRLLRGPGNLTRGLRVTGADNGLDCCRRSVERISFRKALDIPGALIIARSSRIGLSRETDRQSRYFIEGHPGATKAPTRTSNGD